MCGDCIYVYVYVYICFSNIYAYMYVCIYMLKILKLSKGGWPWPRAQKRGHTAKRARCFGTTAYGHLLFSFMRSRSIVLHILLRVLSKAPPKLSHNSARRTFGNLKRVVLQVLDSRLLDY